MAHRYHPRMPLQCFDLDGKFRGHWACGFDWLAAEPDPTLGSASSRRRVATRIPKNLIRLAVAEQVPFRLQAGILGINGEGTPLSLAVIKDLSRVIVHRESLERASDSRLAELLFLVSLLSQHLAGLSIIPPRPVSGRQDSLRTTPHLKMVLPYKLSQVLSQSMWIPEPILTGDNLPDQHGRVAIVTGGYGGVGFEVASILYDKNATVYISGRSETKGKDAIERIRTAHPNSRGRIEFLTLDLADLSTIKPMVEMFMAKETRLHWLNNNAGVMRAPAEPKSAQGMNMQFATNIYGPFLLTKLLLPVLRRTAAEEPPSAVRVTWAGSLGTILSKYAGGLEWEDNGTKLAGDDSLDDAYQVSKAANYLLGVEFGKRNGNEDGVLHVTYNPGNLRTELARHTKLDAATTFIAKALVFDPKHGAYTELFAGLSSQLNIQEDQGGWVVPWGRKNVPMRDDIVAEAQKEKGTAYQIYEWCETITKDWQ